MTWKSRIGCAEDNGNFSDEDKLAAKMLKNSPIADRPEFKTHALVYTDLSDEMKNYFINFSTAVGFSDRIEAKNIYEKIMEAKTPFHDAYFKMRGGEQNWSK